MRKCFNNFIKNAVFGALPPFILASLHLLTLQTSNPQLPPRLQKCLYSKTFAFTLSEVLITLGIISVVAALLIPPLSKTIQDNIYSTQLKKVYSDIYQATTLIKNENGGTMEGLWNTSAKFYCIDSDSCFINMYAKYLKSIDVCTLAQYSDVCWHKTNTWYDVDGSPLTSCDGCKGLH